LIVDYGGVLTSPLSSTVDPWLAAEGLDRDAFRTLMREWFAPDAVPNVGHDLETGSISPADFEREFARRLRRSDGSMPDAEGLLGRMFADFRMDPRMVAVLHGARTHGLRTALLSNSWGFDYDRADWDRLFDAVVISGEVGMRKPDPGIYRHTAGVLGVDPAKCVFVDDLPVNVRGAAAVGMIGLRHTDVETTVEQLQALFGLAFRPVVGQRSPSEGPDGGR